MINSDLNVGGIHRAFIVTVGGDVRIYIPGLTSLIAGTGSVVNEDGTINTESYNENKETLPRPIWCLPNLEAKQHDEVHPCWVTFENGDSKRPIIMGFLGKGIKYHAGGSGGSGSSSGSLSGETGGNTQDTPSKIYNVNTDGYIYPLSKKHTQDPFSGGRQFGASRSNGNRAHAGIDLITPAGTEVIAITDGVVNYICYDFYAGTDAIITKNSDGTWFTYGELTPLVQTGSTIVKGQVIGKIKANNSSGASMLHFETYKGDFDTNVLTTNGDSYLYVPNKKYKRRIDLLDPSYVVNLPMVK